MSGIPQTDWSMIYNLSQEDEKRALALEQLVRRYWPAIYAFIRRSGRDVHEASDLTQGFITTVILQRGLAERAEKKRGRFRSYLLTALRNYLRERHRQETRRRPRDSAGRGAAVPNFDIDAAEGRMHESPEAAFTYHWSAATVRSVLTQVQRECMRNGLELHWAVFEHRVARPLLFGEAPAPVAELVERLDLQGPSTASNMLVTVKRRFASALREEIRATVQADADVEDEIAQLMQDLEKGT